MSAIQDGIMEMAYEAANNILCVKWSDELSVESEQFLQTVTSLFVTINEKRVTNLMVDSGVPSGGVLTEEIIQFFIQQIPNTPLKNIAIQESPDYLWDNNLYQVISLLVSTYALPITVKLVKGHAAGLEWLSQPKLQKPHKTRVR